MTTKFCKVHISVQVKCFQVISSNGMSTYTVNFSSEKPSCTCPDWLKTEMPCKHFFAVFNNTNFSWEQLPLNYR